MKSVMTRLAIVGFLALVPTLGQAQNLLTNGSLNQLQPTDWLDIPAGWQVSTDPQSINTPMFPVRFPGFSSTYSHRKQFGNSGTTNADPALQGFVLNSTEGDFPGFPDVIFVDADLMQTVPGTPGQEYTMSGWAYFEGGFAGGVDTIATGTGTTREGLESLTDVFFALEFLDVGNNVLPGSITNYELRANGQVNNPDLLEASRNWMQHRLNAVAPAGTVSVRVRASMVDGEFNIDMPHQAAWVDDFSLLAVPEPATWVLGLLSLTAVAAVRRRA
jgi:hypothetical protein